MPKFILRICLMPLSQLCRLFCNDIFLTGRRDNKMMLLCSWQDFILLCRLTVGSAIIEKFIVTSLMLFQLRFYSAQFDHVK